VFFLVEPVALPRQERLFYETIDEQAYVRYFEPFRKRQYRQVLRGLGLPAGCSHLDVGASYGWMVEVGLELGLDSLGIEPGEAAARPDVRSRIVRTSLADYAARADRRFDLVTIWHVLEHLPEPAEAMSQMRRLLKDDGRLVVAVPNAEGNMDRAALMLRRVLGSSRLMNELWYFHNANMHFFYYTPLALATLLRRAGLAQEAGYVMEAFDWRTIHQRAAGTVRRKLLQAAGPLIGASRLTGRENLIALARR
jgi:SAM-dependent methyltransferase